MHLPSDVVVTLAQAMPWWQAGLIRIVYGLGTILVIWFGWNRLQTPFIIMGGGGIKSFIWGFILILLGLYFLFQTFFFAG